ncbi:MAG: gamma-glutamyl-phosphate reductase, partial [Clostridia bacterium]|nr:gamma-glutamyl-phosphate reductase [Clostridia bacterium]
MQVKDCARAARQASYQLSALNVTERNRALRGIQEALKAHAAAIFAANQEDLRQAAEENLAAPLLKRLKFDESKLRDVSAGIDSLIALPDPLNRTLLARELSPGLNLYRISCPIGVIGVIFESRPDALVQIATLCVKSGNAALLKGGREALRTNRALFAAIEAGGQGLLPDGWAALLETRD